jgi:sugar/nucleoside kinase (ribokinase family)
MREITPPLRAVVAGHICLDIFPDFTRVADQNLQSVLKPGALVQTGALQFASGGPVSNAGLALLRLGIPVQLIAKIGDDPLGNILRQTIERRAPGLGGGLTADPQSVTSYSIILSNRATDRIFLHCTGANDTFGPEDIDFAPVRKAALFHFGYPPVLRRMYIDGGRDFVEVMRSAKETGATTSLDMCLPDPLAESGRTDWRPIYKAVLPHVDVFLPSFDELLYTLRRDEFQRLSSKGDLLDQAEPGLLQALSGELLEMGVKIVLIKMGGRGVYLRTASENALQAMGRARPVPEKSWAGRERWTPCFQVDVAGTTGSGDSTIAGFLAGLLRRSPIDEALIMAVAVGACNVEAADSLSGLRSWEDTRKRADAGWKQQPLALDSPGWTRDESGRMWIGPLESAAG